MNLCMIYDYFIPNEMEERTAVVLITFPIVESISMDVNTVSVVVDLIYG